MSIAALKRWAVSRFKTPGRMSESPGPRCFRRPTPAPSFRTLMLWVISQRYEHIPGSPRPLMLFYGEWRGLGLMTTEKEKRPEVWLERGLETRNEEMERYLLPGND